MIKNNNLQKKVTHEDQNLELSTVITRKQWNRKTTLWQYLSVFDGVTKQIVLPDSYKVSFFCEMGLFTLHNCCVSWLLNFLKLKLDSRSRLTIPEFSGYHCNKTVSVPFYIKLYCKSFVMFFMFLS